MPKTITIIGAGKVGGALGIALTNAGHVIDRFVVREHARTDHNEVGWADHFTVDSDVVFIATQDAEIASAAKQIETTLSSSAPAVFHTSGALSSEILNDLRRFDCSVGSFHPLVSISGAEIGATRFTGSYFCLEGDQTAVEIASGLVADLGGHAFAIRTDSKALYHASAVTACGHLVGLIDVALEMLCACGIDRDAATDVLLPLISSTVGNLSTQETSEALTGPFARADVQTVGSHLSALDGLVSRNAVEVYLALAERSIMLARDAGADADKLADLRQQILLAKSNLR
jgi:predicted short-subunit dehydrogenase-like oxidoreductase (DUF2520 family)